MIKANFNTYASYVTDSLYQWDLNQVLTVSGLNLSVAPEVHFSNANTGKAIVKQAELIDQVVKVQIPNSLLQEPLTIKVHIGIYEDDTFKIIETVSIPVKPKERPFDYRIENTDGEIYSFNALENLIHNTVDEAKLAYENVRELFDQLDENDVDILEMIQRKANKPSVVEAILSASGWSGNVYSFDKTYPSNEYDIEIVLNSTATKDQASAFNSAQIVGSFTENSVKAFGTIPTIDIPIIVKAVVK